MSWSGCSATSGSRLFMSIRMAASCGQPRQVSAVPRGARTGRGPAGGGPALVAPAIGAPRRVSLEVGLVPGLGAGAATGPKAGLVTGLGPGAVTGLRGSSSPVLVLPAGPGGRDLAGAAEGAGEDGPDVGPGRRA